MPPLTRLPDWPERLAAYLAEHRPHRFAWGAHDCVIFASGAVVAITGGQVLPARWSSCAEAARQLRQAGGLAAAVDQVLPRLTAPLLAQRGDIVLAQQPVAAGRARRQWLAVADGARWWVPSREGLFSGPMAAALIAWRVGHD